MEDVQGSLFGLSIAIACCIVVYLNWEFNSRFDTQNINAGKIYRVNVTRITNGEPIKNGSSPMPLGNNIKTNISEVEKVVRVYPAGGNFKVGDQLFRTDVTCVDPDFFNLFTFHFVSGNSDEVHRC